MSEDFEDNQENDFGEYIRALRMSPAIDMSLRYLAKAIGRSPGYLSQIETGVSPSTGLPPKVDIKDLRALAKVLRVSEAEMIDRANIVPKGFRLISTDIDNTSDSLETVVQEHGYTSDDLGPDGMSDLRKGVEALIIVTAEKQRRERQKAKP